MSAVQASLIEHGPRIGIDPGFTGKVAVVDDRRCYDVRSIPRQPNKGDLDAVRLVTLLRDLTLAHEPSRIYCELIQVWADDRGSMGRTKFTFFESVGALKACIQLSGLPVTYIAPASWKAKLGLVSTKRRPVRKDATRDLACKLLGSSAYPHCAKNTNAADACLIGYIGPQFEFEQRLEATRLQAMSNVAQEDPF